MCTCIYSNNALSRRKICVFPFSFSFSRKFRQRGEFLHCFMSTLKAVRKMLRNAHSLVRSLVVKTCVELTVWKCNFCTSWKAEGTDGMRVELRIMTQLRGTISWKCIPHAVRMPRVQRKRVWSRVRLGIVSRNEVRLQSKWGKNVRVDEFND